MQSELNRTLTTAAAPSPPNTPASGPAGAPAYSLADLPRFPVFIEAPDLSPFISGNIGIDGFTTVSSGQAGPHVVLMSLIHGNEIAGATVLAEMLRENFMPARGKITFGFANLAAFRTFDPENPVASRCVEEDLNRVWDDAQLFGVRRSLELDRAREIRPLIDEADIVLDLHSMLWPSDPLLLCGPAASGRELACRIASPPMVIADQGHAGGKRLIDYGRFTEAASTAACILVEAGQHWEPATISQMRATVSALLRHTGQMMPNQTNSAQPRYAEVSHVITAKTNRFVFTEPFRGGDIIAQAQTLIAHDGDEPITTPYDNCLLVMPSLRPSRGHTAVRLAVIK